MTKEQLSIYRSPYAGLHDTGHGHPESIARAQAIEDLLSEKPFCGWPQIESVPVSDDLLLKAHDQRYIAFLEDSDPPFAIDGDTILSEYAYQAALHGAGACEMAVNDIAAGKTKRAFCAVRPPGHHAEHNRAMGFCFINNIMVAAIAALQSGAFKRPVIVDFDVHHGNGSEEIAARWNAGHPQMPIAYISTHAYPLFPMSGKSADNGDTLLNIPLPPDFDSQAFKDAYTQQVFPFLESYKPDLLLLSAGFDAHMADPLAPARLNTEDFIWLTQKLAEIADKHCQGRILSALEGGYDIDALKECVAAHLNCLKNAA